MGLLGGGVEKVQVKCLEQWLAYSRCSINMSHASDAASLSHVYTCQGVSTGTVCAFVWQLYVHMEEHARNL